MEHKKFHRRIRHWIAFPFIWIMAIPVIILDLSIELYHRICFPLYGIAYVKRSDYIKIDRYKLPYLNLFDRINCFYCEYVNGFLAYSVAIAGATEKYWCGIKHEASKNYHEPKHHANFIEYHDKKSYNKLCKLQHPNKKY